MAATVVLSHVRAPRGDEWQRRSAYPWNMARPMPPTFTSPRAVAPLPGLLRNAFTVRSAGLTGRTNASAGRAPEPLSRAQQRVSLQLLLCEAMRHAYRSTMRRQRRLRADDTALEMVAFQLECTWGNLVSDINDTVSQLGPDADLGVCITYVAMLELFQRYSNATPLRINRDEAAGAAQHSRCASIGEPSGAQSPVVKNLSLSNASDDEQQDGYASPGGLSDGSLSPADDGATSPHSRSLRASRCAPPAGAPDDDEPLADHVPLEWAAVLRDDTRRSVVEARRVRKLRVLQCLPPGAFFHASI